MVKTDQNLHFKTTSIQKSQKNPNSARKQHPISSTIREKTPKPTSTNNGQTPHTPSCRTSTTQLAQRTIIIVHHPTPKPKERSKDISSHTHYTITNQQKTICGQSGNIHPYRLPIRSLAGRISDTTPHVSPETYRPDVCKNPPQTRTPRSFQKNKKITCAKARTCRTPGTQPRSA